MTDDKLDLLQKEAWGPGPWQDELDEATFEHLGFQCRIARDEVAGHLCGYIVIPESHPWSSRTPAVVVYGGFTYSREHVEGWVLGFDCGHGGLDLSPGIPPELRQRTRELIDGLGLGEGTKATYKDFPFVRHEIEKLAEAASRETP